MDQKIFESVDKYIASCSTDDALAAAEQSHKLEKFR
jgi:hypothetical protein